MGDVFSVSGTRVTRGKKLAGFCIMSNAHLQVNLAGPLARTNRASLLVQSQGNFVSYFAIVCNFRVCEALFLIDFYSLVRPYYTPRVRAQETLAPTLSIFGLLFGPPSY
jgi:hypothetical protein